MGGEKAMAVLAIIQQLIPDPQRIQHTNTPGANAYRNGWYNCGS